MSLYAVDQDDLIHADDAHLGKIYRCLNCFGPVKMRRRKWKFSHFYHVQKAPACRFYSKSEGHLAAQVELQRLFPKGALQMERSFTQIHRIADACWEKEKIVFEVQCSQITEKEAQMRIHDYLSIGYDVVWLLDDKRYNKRVLRPAEEFLRSRSAYFLSIGEMAVYDQFEGFSEGRRVWKGKSLPVDLRQVRNALKTEFCKELYPKQIVPLRVNRHFYGDRLSRALQFPQVIYPAQGIPSVINKLARVSLKKQSRLILWFKKYIGRPYLRWLENRLRGC